MYAKNLTREDLKLYGITEVTEDCRIFVNGVERNLTTNCNGYFVFNTYALDENGQRIKLPDKRPGYTYIYKSLTLGLHRIMWAWHKGEVPEGMIVDHKNNSHTHIEDYYLSNLQLLTPSENIAKERDNWHVRELKCNLNKPRSHYEDKLAGYTLAYEQAKKDKDVKGAHRLRCNIAQVRARLRYYDRHIEEYLKEKEAKKPAEHECHARAEKRRELQANIDSNRKFYQEMLAAYGKDDEITKQAWGEWKLAIAMMYGFKEECKRAKQAETIC